MKVTINNIFILTCLVSLFTWLISNVSTDWGLQTVMSLSGKTMNITTGDPTYPLNVVVSGDVGKSSSMLLVNGHPAIAYFNETSNLVQYVRANDTKGSSWGIPVTIDTSLGNDGSNISLLLVDGHPAIAYMNRDTLDLKYVRATDNIGSSWGTPITIDTDNALVYSSMILVEGVPAIAYFTFSGMKYVRATDTIGSSWGTPVIVDTGPFIGFDTSLAVISGRPAIAYRNGDLGDIKYVRANDTTGTTWGTPLTIDDVVGYYPSLAEIAGRPAISYAKGEDLVYVRATDETGSNWSAPLYLDISGNNTGFFSDLFVVDGYPAISYQGNKTLRYIRATNTTGTTWGNPVSVDRKRQTGQDTSLTIIDGRPAISYYSILQGNLRYARALDATGASWYTPVGVVIEDEPTYSNATQMLMVNNQPAIHYRALNDLRFTRAIDATGESWNSPINLLTDNSSIFGHEMAIVSGNPALAYYDRNALGGGLYYRRATDAVGDNWASSTQISTNHLPGQRLNTLLEVDGYPAIVYFSGYHDTYNFYYRRATDSIGTQWSTPITISVGNHQPVSFMVSSTLINGKPAISYIESASRSINYLQAIDIAGTQWTSPTTVVTASASFDHDWSITLAEINGRPAIGYNIGFGTQYVRASDANGENWGIPATIDSKGRNISLATIRGNPAISYYDNNALTLNFARELDTTGDNWEAPIVLDGWADNVGFQASMAEVNGAPVITYIDDSQLDIKYLYVTYPFMLPQLAMVDTTLLWSSSGLTCQYDVHESLEPYSGFTSVAQGLSVLSYEVTTLPPAFYQIESVCEGVRLDSNTIGMFTFTVVAGD